MRPQFCALVLSLFSLLVTPLLAGSLQINLSPAEAVTAGAQWRVDGGTWQNSGATISSLAAGSHTVEYNTLAGYTGPATETVSLADADQLTLSRSYAVTTGLPAQLTVTLTPITGKWRIDGGTWRSSGTTATGLLSGPHTLEYSVVANHASPPTETFTLLSGANSLQRSYTELAQITVALTPSTAKWRLNGGSWLTSKTYVSSLTPGTYTIEYSFVSGYATPPTETVTLVVGTNAFQRSYTQLSQLTVSLTPSTAKWRIDSGTWRNSGYIAYNLSPGNHLLEYSDPAGITALPAETVTLVSGPQTLTRTLDPAGQSAQVTVTLSPASAQWRVDGGAWQASGTTIAHLATGGHTIEYNTLAGYSTPASETVTLAAAQSLSLNRSFAIQPTQLTITLTPGTGQWRVDGRAWQASGATVTDLAAGNHPIEYNSLGGYSSPPPETITLATGQVALLARSYIPLLYTVESMGVGGLYDPAGLQSGGAHAINLEGAVAGATTLHGEVVGYIYANGVVEETGHLGGAGFNLDLNDSHVAAGFSLMGSPSFARHATRYANGALQGIDPGGTAFGVNSAGAVVGSSGSGSAFLHLDGALYDLGKWGGQQAAALDINDSDVIVGAASIDASTSQAVRYHDGQVDVIPGLGGTANRANAINNAGVVAGDGSLAGTAPRHAFRHANGATQDLGTLGGANSRALDINEAGVIVGWSEMADNTVRAFVYRDGSMLDLNGVVSLPPGVVLTAATGVNASGQIIANGSDGIGYILTPVTNMGGVSLQLAGGIGQWRVDGGAWQNPGAIVSGLPAGPHTIEYATVADYTAPTVETVTINGGRTTVVRRNYTSIPAQLNITITPNTGQWRIDGGAWRPSGYTETALSAGDHQVEYFGISGYLNPASEVVTLAPGQSVLLARTYTQLPDGAIAWANNGTDFATPANWTGAVAPADNTSDNVGVFAGNFTSAQPVLAANRSIGGLVQDALATTDLNLTGVGTLTLGARGIVNAKASGTMTIALPLALPAAATPVDVAVGGQTVIAGNLSGNSLNKTGDGTLLLLGNATQTTTDVHAGTLQIGNGGSGGSVTGGIWTTGYTSVVFNRSQDLTHFGTISGSGTLTKLGTNTMTLSAYSPIKNLSVSAGTLVVPTASRLDDPAVTVEAGATLEVLNEYFHSLTGSGRVKLGTILLGSGTGYSTGTFSGSITGLGSIAKFGLSTWILTGANDFTGTMFVNEGVVTAGAANTLSPNSLVDVKTTLNLADFDQVIKDLSGQTGAVVSLGSATLTINNDEVGHQYSGAINGTGGVRKTGAGSFRLSNSQLSFTGPFQITEGSVVISAGNFCLPALAPMTVDAAGTLVLNSTAASHAVGSLSGSGVVNLGQSTLSVGGNNASTNFWGVIQGSGLSGRLIKVGSGTLTLSGASTYAKPTTISAGILHLGNTNGSALGTGNVTVATGATLAGTGSFTGALTLNGILAPGASPGTLTTGSQTWNGGGSYLWEINDTTGIAGTNWDHDSINGTLTIAATQTSRFTIALRSLTSANATGQVANFNPASSYSFTIASTTSISGFNASAFTIDTSGFTNPFTGTWSVAQVGTALNLVYTPTPATAQLTVSLTPGTGQWRVDAGAWQASGATVTGLSAGNHTVEYNGLAGYTNPANETVVLSTGQSLSLDRSYTPAPTQLTVTLVPATGQWRLTTETAWQASGTTVPLTPGTYSIYYAPLAGYNGPINDTITVSLGQSLELTRNYTPITAPPSYTAVQISSPDGNWNTANAINNFSVVAGQKHMGGANFHAYRHDSEGMQDLGALGGISSAAHGINQAGTIVGQAQTPAGHTHAFVTNGGTLQDLGTLGGTYSTAADINENGWIVGTSSLANGLYHAFQHDGGSMVDLGTLGGNHSSAHGINQTNVIVGESNTVSGDNHAFMWTAGVMQDLGTFGGSWSTAYDINNSGMVVGGAEIVAGTPHAFISSGGTLQDLGTLSTHTSSVALAINNAGTVVGYAFTNQQVDLRPFIYVDGVMTDINTLVNIPGVLLTQARDINDLGQIIVYGTNFVTDVSFILTPVSAPVGNLQVNLTPAAAQWRVDGGAWQASGATITGLPVGSHTIEYSSLAGYAAPANDTVTIVAGQTAYHSVSYTALGSVRAYMVPSAESRWRLDGGEWLISGTDTIHVSLGSHLVEFMDIPGYITPAAQTITVVSGQTTDVSVSYTAVQTVAAFTVTDLGTLGGSSSFATGLNLAGTVTGFSYTPGNAALHAFRYTNGIMTDLGTLGGTYSQAYGINDAGTVVGTSATTDGVARGFQFKDGVMQILPTLGGTTNEGYAINNKGTIVGFSQMADSTFHAYRYRNGAMEDLGTLGGQSSLAMGLNESDSVVGMAMIQPDNSQYRAFLRGEAAMQNLGSLGGDHSQANNINESGVIVGSSRLAQNMSEHAFRYQDGLLTDLGTLGGQSARAFSINNSGTIVGTADNASQEMQAFIHRNGVLQNLNSLVDLPGVTLTDAVGLNDLGQIAVNAGPNGHAYLLTPINAPGGLQLDLLPANGQWRVDSGAWQTSGSPVLGLAIGNHTVEYGTLGGYTTPAPETVTIASGRLLQLSRSYAAVPQQAQLTITLSPAGAQWRVNGGAWQNSGATVSSLAAGNHTVDYNTVAGYTGPASEIVSLAAGDQLSLARNYAVTTGLPAQLTITLAPTTGKWRIDGGSWRSSGNTVTGLLSGAHTLEYSVVANHASPPTETVTLLAGANSLQRSYTELAQITIALTPSTAKWRLDGGTWRNSLAYISSLTPGSHTIEYSFVSGYVTPPTETVTLVVGTTSLQRSYTQLAQLTVTLTPTTGKWRIDGGTWRNSGSVATDLAAGAHSIEYSSVTGYATPPTETVTLASGSNTLQRTYQ